MFLIFDTETIGLPKNYNAPYNDLANWPRMVQLAWQIHSATGELVCNKNYIVIPEGFEIPYQSEQIHGISTEKAKEIGHDLKFVLAEFNKDLETVTHAVAHNFSFDLAVLSAEYIRAEMPNILSQKIAIDTKDVSTDFCKNPGGRGGQYKWPKLTELHTQLFQEDFIEAHNASADVNATARCFLELIRIGVITHTILQVPQSVITAFKKAQPTTIQAAHIELQSNFETKETQKTDVEPEIIKTEITHENKQFVHLHVHTQYSILDGAAAIDDIVDKAVAQGMPALAITDHGAMFGVKDFHQTCIKKGIKPILGCEAYLVDDLADEKDRNNYHCILLAKNYVGYKNLLKLISTAHLKGMYYRPRIDKIILEQHKEGLIMLSACLGGEVAKTLTTEGVAAAEKSILWYKSIFQDDFYLEVMRHPTQDPQLRKEVYERQKYVNKELFKLGAKHDIKIVATNDVHFTEEQDAGAHDILICLNTGADIHDMRRVRYTRQEWFKTTDEMYELWADAPEVLANTLEVADKVEEYTLNSNPIMPEFAIPESFGTIEDYKQKYSEEALRNEFERYDNLGGYEAVVRIKFESDYLKQLTYLGAKKRYGENMPEKHKERIDFELETIAQMGFPGYFLIVQDFIEEARNMGVLVGPGRGSAAGSVVSYCLSITNIDPIKFDLLFERFLNPDRISMPDIDIDFDDDGRQKVLDWVTEKYGHDKVAHICTFGTMAAKSALKDVARVLQLPLSEANRMTKEFPENGKLNKSYSYIRDLEKKLGNLDKVAAHIIAQKRTALQEEKPKDVIKADVRLFILNELKSAEVEHNQIKIETIENACVLEGSVRQYGVHACGIIIGKNSLDEHVPLMPTKEEHMMTTQYDGRFVEEIGLLKMDFLGLRTLSIIKEALSNIKLSTGKVIDIEAIDFTDQKTFELFGKGDTTAIFQFESAGMKKHLRNLKPNRFEDLVAMNALYRPGPMEYIPEYIARKHGQRKVVYDHPIMKKYLSDTYGITVFQEQVMLLSRELAQFTRGESDELRKAMGKKIIAIMDKLKEKFHKGCLGNKLFIDGCAQNNQDPELLIEKIWKDWEAFAAYAFNKSHSVCYAYIAFQTAFLKAHYPAQFMAAALSCNLSKADEIAKLMEECNRMGTRVLVPDVNESQINFAVNKKRQIRFGLGAIKGVGETAAQSIIEERVKNGPFADIFDFVARVNLRTVNKKNLESLALSGAFDSFGIERHRFFAKEGETSFIETLLKFGNALNSTPEPNMLSLFADDEIAVEKPVIPNPPLWSNMEQLRKEKEHIGIYLSAHPLDEYKFIIKHFCKISLNELADIILLKDRSLCLAGMVTKLEHRETKTGKPFMKFTLEDFNGNYEFVLFGKDCETFSSQIIMGDKICIQGKVEKKWGDSTDYHVKIKEIEPLSILKKRIKTCNIRINILDLNDALISQIDDLISQINTAVTKKDKEDKEEEQKFPVKFQIYDRYEEIYITMNPQGERKSISHELFEELQNIDKIDFSLN
ncbi:MAG: DNA polymerase III subunit alpha [Bacteroidales bacterium]|nr:DNA polymerase III subunit alpha [Bacteroidales bacterium]